MTSEPISAGDGPAAYLPTLETPRLIVRPLAMTDLDAVHRLYLDIDWADADLGDEENFERRRSWLTWTIDGYREFARLRQPQYGERAIASRADGALVGLIGMVPCLAPFGQLPSEGGHEGAPASAEVGLFWALSPPAQGQGLATEAARAFTAYLFDRYKARRLVATTDYDNARSISVMRKLGMRMERNPFADPFYLQVVGVLDAPA